MNSSDLIALIPVAIIFSVVAVILLVGRLIQRKAREVGRELVERHFPELRLLSDCTLMRGFFPDKGILALLADRMIFVSLLFDKRLEIPLAEVTGIKLPKVIIPSRSNMRGFAVLIGPRKLNLSMNMLIANAWQVALQKSAPMLAAGAMPKIG